MPTKCDRVKAEINKCDLWYVSRNCNIHTLNERIEGLWYEVRFHVARMELAERDRNPVSADYHLDCIVRDLTRIYAEAEQERSR